MGISQKQFRKQRWNLGDIQFINVWIRAAEFESDTAYMYSTYDEECESNPSNKDKIMVIGGGPNRIGQGVSSSITAVYTRRLQCVMMVLNHRGEL